MGTVHDNLLSPHKSLLADDSQRHELFRLRGRENRSTAFVYPPLGYTISEGDLSPPSVWTSSLP